MGKLCLVTGATDGIGRLTAETLVQDGHQVVLHGRDNDRVQAVLPEHSGIVGRVCSDFADLAQVRAMAAQILEAHDHLDVIINNAGVLKTDITETPDGLDTRFSVNTVAPYLLTQALVPHISPKGRVVNIVSAALTPVDPRYGFTAAPREHMEAYSQSKLALLLWTRAFAAAHPDGPVFLALNPGSLLASKMVKDAFGYRGRSLSIGAERVCEAALGGEFASKSGAYFDNDKGVFADVSPECLTHDQEALVAAELARCEGLVNKLSAK